MDYILLVLAIVLAVSKNLISKIGKNEFEGLDRLMSANMLAAVTAMVLFACSGMKLSVMTDPIFILLAFLYGVFILAAQSLYMLALKSGSVSICSLIYSSGFLIPTFYSALVLGEPISLTKWIGIFVMLAAIFAVSAKGEKPQQNSSKVYLVYTVIAMLMSGALGVMQKLLVKNYGDKCFNEYLFVSFFFMLLGILVLKLFAKIKAEERVKIYTKRFWILGILFAIGVAVVNKMNLYLSGALPGVIFFPCSNGGIIMLSTLCSAVMFKERLTKIGWAGIITGVAAIVLIAF